MGENMEEIKNIKNFSTCINCLNKAGAIGRVIKRNDKTIISVFDGVVFVLCEIPELKKEYDNNIDLRTIQKLCKTLHEQDVLKLIINDDIIEAKVHKPKSERTYKFPNLIDEDIKQQDKAIEKAMALNPPNEVHTSPEWIVEQIDALIFKDSDKNLHKVIMHLKEKRFSLNDDNKTIGESTVSLLSFDEYKIKFKNESKVKINYYLIKDIIAQMKQFSNKIMVKMDNDYPVKFMCYDQSYKITVIVAPMIEND